MSEEFSNKIVVASPVSIESGSDGSAVEQPVNDGTPAPVLSASVSGGPSVPELPPGSDVAAGRGPLLSDRQLELVTNVMVKNVAASTRRVYRIDAGHFSRWLTERGLRLQDVTFEEISDYRAHLADTVKNKGTATRRLVIARRMLEVAVILKLRSDNPAEYVKGFSLGQQETTHHALNRAQAKALLESIDRSTNKGKRDYALVSLVFRTGMRRAEAAGLTLGDLSQEQGHNIAIIQHGKGDKRRIAKIPVDVRRAIDEYLAVTGRLGAPVGAPVFVRFKKGDKPKLTGLDGRDIERIVSDYARSLGLDLTPHGLRASFITQALENGAKLEQVQYAAGHADPRTTERYQKRKINLDSNAVDFVWL